MSKSRTILIITSACSAYLLSPKANLKIEKGKKNVLCYNSNLK